VERFLEVLGLRRAGGVDEEQLLGFALMVAHDRALHREHHFRPPWIVGEDRGLLAERTSRRFSFPLHPDFRLTAGRYHSRAIRRASFDGFEVAHGAGATRRPLAEGERAVTNSGRPLLRYC